MTITPHSPASRKAAAVIAFVTMITLATRVYLRMDLGDNFFQALSYLSQFFTILTNTVVLVMTGLIASGKNISPRFTKTITIAIVGVGLFYHVLLAHLVDNQGLALLADHGVHTFVPLFTALWWVFLAPKAPLQTSDLGLWIVWPLTYCAYILIRGHFSGFYAYPFLNVPEIGWSSLVTNVVGLSVAFAVLGLLLTGVARLVSGRPSKLD
jgi:hypothetical protein